MATAGALGARGDGRARITRAALELFRERGYEPATLQEVADRLGVTKAAVYYHWRRKDDLLAAVVEPLLDRLDAVVDAHPARPAWPDGTRALLADYLDALLDHRDLAAWVDGDKAVRDHPVIGERLRANSRAVTRAITAPLARLEGTAGETEAQRVRASAALGGLWRPLRNLGDRLDVAAHREALLDAAMAACLPLMGDDAGDGATGSADGAAARPADRRLGSGDRRLGGSRA